MRGLISVPSKDIILLQGRVEEHIYYKGELDDVVKGCNRIVRGAGPLLAGLLAFATPDKRVTQIGFGTGGAVATPDNTTLTDPFYKNLTSADEDTIPGSVIFHYAISESECNGVTLRERGLFSESGVMFSRLKRPDIVKTDSIAISGQWIIEFMGA